MSYPTRSWSPALLRSIVAVALTLAAIAGCSTSSNEVPASVTVAEQDDQWQPPLTATRYGVDVQPDDQAVQVRLLLVNTDPNQALTLGPLGWDGPLAGREDESGFFRDSSVDSAEPFVVPDGPYALADEVDIASTGSVGMVADLEVDCDSEEPGELWISVTDGAVRTQVAVDDFAIVDDTDWPATILDCACARS